MELKEDWKGTAWNNMDLLLSNGQKRWKGIIKKVWKMALDYWKDTGHRKASRFTNMANCLVTRHCEPGSKTRYRQNVAVPTPPTPPPPPHQNCREKTASHCLGKLHGVLWNPGWSPYTGPVVKYQKNGLKELDGYFTRGKKTGKWVYYTKRRYQGRQYY